MKVVINCRYGGFKLSEAAELELGWDNAYTSDRKDRTDPKLIALMEEKGAAYVGGDSTDLQIIDIPEKYKFWDINDYDGYESITASETEVFRFVLPPRRKDKK